MIVGGNERLKCEVSAMMLNAISGARDIHEALASLRSLAQQMGLTPDAIAQRLVGMYQQGAISETQLKEHLAYLDVLAGYAPPPAAEPATNAAGAPGAVGPVAAQEIHPYVCDEAAADNGISRAA